MGDLLKAGTTQVTRTFTYASSTTGEKITGAVAATIQTPVLYLVDGAVKGTITLSNLASEGASFSAGGLFERGAGKYRLDFTTSGAAQTITIAASGTAGEFFEISNIQIADSAAMYTGVNLLALQGSVTLNGSSLPEFFTDNLDVAVSTRMANDWISVNGRTGLQDIGEFYDANTFMPPIASGTVTGGTINLAAVTTNLTNNTPTSGTITNFNGPFTSSAFVVSAGTITLNGSVILQRGLYITNSVSNQPGLSVTGNGQHGALFTGGTNSAGIHAAGQGSGAGFYPLGGATGPGIKVQGGATSGAGIQITTTSGAGIDANSVLVAAGTLTLNGGVIANITGNLSGTVGTLTNNADKTGYSGVMTAGTLTANNDKTGYSSVMTAGTLTLNNDKTGYSITSGTITSYTGNTPQTGDVYAKFNTMIVLDGAVYQFTANALELGPSGAGLTANQAQTLADLKQMIANPGSSNAQYTAVALELGPAGGGGFGGPSATTFNFFGTDGSTAVSNVIFTVQGVGTTVAANGSKTVNLNDGSGTVTAGPSGNVMFSPQAFTVSGTTIVNVIGTDTPWTPATNPLQSRCYLRCYDQQFAVDPTGRVTIQVVNPAASGAALANELVVHADADGDVLDPVDGGKGVLLGLNVEYRAHRGTTADVDEDGESIRWTLFTPNANPFNIPANIGWDTE